MSNMTIAQGLRRVKKIKGELAEQLTRAHGAVTYRSDMLPAFEFESSLSKAKELRKELIEMESAIAKANATNTVSVDGHEMSLTQAVRTLKEYKGELAWLETLKGVVRNQTNTFTEESEIDWDSDRTKRVKVRHDWICVMPEAERAKATDKVREQFDTLNNLVEEANHRITL